MLLCFLSDPDELAVLMEMFPNLNKSDISLQLVKCNGDLDHCTYQLLELSDRTHHGKPLTQLQEKPSSSKVSIHELNTKWDFHFVFYVHCESTNKNQT